MTNMIQLERKPIIQSDELSQVYVQISNAVGNNKEDLRMRCDVSIRAQGQDKFLKLVFNCTARHRETEAKSRHLRTIQWLKPYLDNRRQYLNLMTGHALLRQPKRKKRTDEIPDTFNIAEHLLVLWKDVEDDGRQVGMLYMNQHQIPLAFYDDLTEGQREKGYVLESRWQALGKVLEIHGSDLVDAATGEIVIQESN